MTRVEHTVGREVQRNDGKRNHVKCSQNRPSLLSLRVRQIEVFLVMHHLRPCYLPLSHDGEVEAVRQPSELPACIIVLFLKLSVTETSRDWGLNLLTWTYEAMFFFKLVQSMMSKFADQPPPVRRAYPKSTPDNIAVPN